MASNRDWTWFYRLGSPRWVYETTSRWLPWLLTLTLVLLTAGLVWGLGYAPQDAKQGNSFRIIYLHVPVSFLALAGYYLMAIAGAIGLIWKMKLSYMVMKSAAPIGAALTFLALFTGAVWGKPTWGTYWVWDPRLTAFAILTLFYIGYIILWTAEDEPDKAADLTSILCLVGSVFALLSRYAVLFWNQGLHQGASLSLDKEKNVADVFYQPLLFSIIGFVFLFLFLLLIRMRTEIWTRQINAIQQKLGK